MGAIKAMVIENECLKQQTDEMRGLLKQYAQALVISIAMIEHKGCKDTADELMSILETRRKKLDEM